MLNIKKSITLNGESMINGVVAEQYQAVIDSVNPIDMTISSWIRDKVLYKENRTICRQDSAEFEDNAYDLQDSMLAAKESEE